MKPVIRFSIALFLLTFLILGGTLGYSLIEKWSFWDSIYMTFITMTTVGFAEVHPLSVQGRHFTIIFLIFSLTTVGYFVTTLITFVFEGHFLRTVKERHMRRTIDRLKDHYIICGCGAVGREVALEFKRSGVRFVVVDRNPEQSDLARDESILFVKGDAIDDETLMEACIDRAKGLISALPDDEANVYIVLSARQLKPDIMIVSKAADERSIRKLHKAGANRVISSSQIAGHRMASLILRPTVADFLDIVTGADDIAMRIEEVRLESGSPLIGKTLRDAGIGQHTGAMVVGIHDTEGHTRINPSTTASLSSLTL